MDEGADALLRQPLDVQRQTPLAQRVEPFAGLGRYSKTIKLNNEKRIMSYDILNTAAYTAVHNSTN